MSHITVAICVTTFNVTSGISKMSHDLIEVLYQTISACMPGDAYLYCRYGHLTFPRRPVCHRSRAE